mmetsp:Transcript_13894/g.39186  ORF Transcript_13894/g.39186 Transcript_13894/m.39186 type:complete len:205 (-) Transcript_13894:577-1191(-)
MIIFVHTQTVVALFFSLIRRRRRRLLLLLGLLEGHLPVRAEQVPRSHPAHEVFHAQECPPPLAPRTSGAERVRLGVPETPTGRHEPPAARFIRRVLVALKGPLLVHDHEDCTAPLENSVRSLPLAHAIPPPGHQLPLLRLHELLIQLLSRLDGDDVVVPRATHAGLGFKECVQVHQGLGQMLHQGQRKRARLSRKKHRANTSKA